VWLRLASGAHWSFRFNTRPTAKGLTTLDLLPGRQGSGKVYPANKLVKTARTISDAVKLMQMGRLKNDPCIIPKIMGCIGWSLGNHGVQLSWSTC